MKGAVRMQQQLSKRQATLWFIMYFIGSAFFLIPPAIISAAGRDAWLTVPAMLLLYAPALLLYGALAKQMQGQPVHRHMAAMFGRWIGPLLTILYVLGFAYSNFMMTLRNLGDFYTNAIVPRMPIEVVIFVMLVAVYVAIRSGLSTIGRSAEVMFFVIPVLYLMVTFTLLPTTRLNHLLPIFENGWKPIVHGAIPLLAFPYLEAPLFLSLAPYMNNLKQWKKAIVGSVCVTGVMYLVMLMHVIAVLGAEVAVNLMYPTYFVVRTVSIVEFIERFEILVAVLWYISMFYRLCLLMFVTSQEIAGALSLRDPSPLLIPLMMVALIMALTIWPNNAFWFEFLMDWSLYAAVGGIVLPALLLLFGLLRQGKQRHAGAG